MREKTGEVDTEYHLSSDTKRKNLSIGVRNVGFNTKYFSICKDKEITMLKGSKTIFAVIGILPLIESCGKPQDGAAETQAYGGVNQRVATPAASGGLSTTVAVPVAPGATSTAVLTTDETDAALRKDGGHGWFVPSKNPTARLFYGTAGDTTRDATCTGVLLKHPTNNTKRFVLTSRLCLKKGILSEDSRSSLVQRVGFAGTSKTLRVVKAYHHGSLDLGSWATTEAASLAVLELEDHVSTRSSPLYGREGMPLTAPTLPVDKFSVMGYGNTQNATGKLDTGKLVRIDAAGQASIAQTMRLSFPSGSGLAYGDEGAPVFALKYGPEQTVQGRITVGDDWGILERQGLLGSEQLVRYKSITHFNLISVVTHTSGGVYFSDASPSSTIRTDPLRSPVLWVQSVLDKALAGTSLTGVATVTEIPNLVEENIVVPNPSQVADWPSVQNINQMNSSQATNYTTQDIVSELLNGVYIVGALGMDYDPYTKAYVNVNNDVDYIRLNIPDGKTLEFRMSKGGTQDGLPELTERMDMDVSISYIGENPRLAGVSMPFVTSATRFKRDKFFNDNVLFNNKYGRGGGSGTRIDLREVYVGLSKSAADQLARGQLYAEFKMVNSSGYELYWDGVKVSGSDADLYTFEQAVANCNANITNYPRKKVRCVFRSEIPSVRWEKVSSNLPLFENRGCQINIVDSNSASSVTGCAQTSTFQQAKEYCANHPSVPGADVTLRCSWQNANEQWISHREVRR